MRLYFFNRSNLSLEDAKLFLTDIENSTLYLFGNGSLNVLEKYSSKLKIEKFNVYKKNTHKFIF